MAYLFGTKNIKLVVILLCGLLYSSNVWAQGEPDNSVPTEATSQVQQVQTPESPTVDSGTWLDTKLELFQYIDKYADRELGTINYIVTALAGISFFFLSVIGYFAKRYTDDIKNTVGLTATTFLDERFNTIEALNARFKKVSGEYNAMSESMNEYVKQYNDVKESLVGLRELEERAGATQDASYAYRRCTILVQQYQGLSNHDQGGEEGKAMRVEVSALLDIIESEALKGSVTATTVFNAAANAGRMNDSLRSLRLMTLSVNLEPSDAHQMAKLDEEYKMGISYEVSDGTISRIGGDADTIRKAVFAKAMEIVAKGKRQQNEIIVSRAWNMAERGRENGALDALIEVLVGLVDKQDKKDLTTIVTSYVYVILAQLHGRQAEPGWAAKADGYFKKAIDLLAVESPMATWYESSKRELGTNAKRLGMYEEIKEYADGKNVDFSTSEDRDGDGLPAGMMAALMAAAQQRENGGGSDDLG